MFQKVYLSFRNFKPECFILKGYFLVYKELMGINNFGIRSMTEQKLSNISTRYKKCKILTPLKVNQKKQNNYRVEQEFSKKYQMKNDVFRKYTQMFLQFLKLYL